MFFLEFCRGENVVASVFGGDIDGFGRDCLGELDRVNHRINESRLTKVKNVSSTCMYMPDVSRVYIVERTALTKPLGDRKRTAVTM